MMPTAAPRHCDRCRRPYLGRLCPCRSSEIVDEIMRATTTDTAPHPTPAPGTPAPGIVEAADVEAMFERYVTTRAAVRPAEPRKDGSG
ncbi:hypothetical protein [Rhodococcus pyridinivorans]|uniref:Uncharacterized protein n=1 Tax=Rhodococcus pyridinivorans TaxID=103816 RepID=A0A7M2XRU0_9NOCA|nr:hypothetical protein [Rhodococcus pyridinivorans]QOW00489.1 hypothetical protein INP59_09295 [Rhodococcus pyridinivorans]